MRLDVKKSNHSRDHGPDLLAKAQYNPLFSSHVTDAVSRSLALPMRSALGLCGLISIVLTCNMFVSIDYTQRPMLYRQPSIERQLSIKQTMCIR